MTLAILYSNQKKLISNDKLLRAFDLIEQFQLPTYFNFHKKQIIDSLKKDKKKDGGFINFVFLNDLGKSKVIKTPIIEIEDFINRMYL
jgi:3-dehydroquinate synthetase